MKTAIAHSLRKTMIILFMGLSILMSLSIVSCSKDEDDPQPEIDVKNELKYNGETYSLNYGGLSDYGFDGSHTNYEFHLFKFISDEDPLIPIYLFVDLFSPNESGFKTGTFQYINTDGPVDLDGKYYFDDGYLIRNMNTADETADEIVYIKSGTVKVSGEGNQYKVAFDLLMDNGKTVKGSYDGSFEVFDSESVISRHKAIGLRKKE